MAHLVYLYYSENFNKFAFSLPDDNDILAGLVTRMYPDISSEVIIIPSMYAKSILNKIGVNTTQPGTILDIMVCESWEAMENRESGHYVRMLLLTVTNHARLPLFTVFDKVT